MVYNKPNYKLNINDDYTIINNIIKNYLINNLFTINIVKIESLNGNKVNVLPTIQQQTTNNEIIEITNNDIIYNVPVLFLQGGNCQISFKLNKGDYGFLITTKDNSLNFVKSLNNSISTSKKRFDLSSSFFLPFQIVNINSNILIKNENSQIEITPTKINITGDVNINGDLNITGISKANDHLSGSISNKTHKHGGVQPGSGTTTPPQ